MVFNIWQFIQDLVLVEEAINELLTLTKKVDGVVEFKVDETYPKYVEIINTYELNFKNKYHELSGLIDISELPEDLRLIVEAYVKYLVDGDWKLYARHEYVYDPNEPTVRIQPIRSYYGIKVRVGLEEKPPISFKVRYLLFIKQL